MPEAPFRIGSTSYVYPADLVSNVRQLAGVVDDIELVLFDTEDYGHNLPDGAAVEALRAIARDHSMTYTVHLPCDVRFDDASAWRKVQRAVNATRELEPFAYVMHLDGRELMETPSAETIARWRDMSAQALGQVIELIGDRRLVCVENLERWDPVHFHNLVMHAGVSRCVDVGHWWVQGRDPLPHLREHYPQTRVVHLHGVDGDGRDHQSLRHTPLAQLRSVVEALVDADYRGVLSLEVFGEADFLSSLDVLRQVGQMK
jgi:sugar phosphate isomerase/epimerase